MQLHVKDNWVSIKTTEDIIEFKLWRHQRNLTMLGFHPNWGKPK